jgi:hypothetical protein
MVRHGGGSAAARGTLFVMTLLLVLGGPVATSAAATGDEYSCRVDKFTLNGSYKVWSPTQLQPSRPRPSRVGYFVSNGSSQGVCVTPTEPTAFPVTIALDASSDWPIFSLYDCTAPGYPGEGTHLYAPIRITRSDGTSVTTTIVVHAGNGDPVEPRGPVVGPGPDGSGTMRWDFSYELYGQSRCLGDPITSVELNGFFTSPASAQNFAASGAWASAPDPSDVPDPTEILSSQR